MTGWISPSSASPGDGPKQSFHLTICNGDEAAGAGAMLVRTEGAPLLTSPWTLTDLSAGCGQLREVDSRRKYRADSPGGLTRTIVTTLLQHKSGGQGINGLKKLRSPTAVEEAEGRCYFTTRRPEVT